MLFHYCMDQNTSSSPIQSQNKQQLTSKSKGGRARYVDVVDRQLQVELLLKKGYGLSEIASTKINNKKLGAIDTIKKDIIIIKSRWLDSDLNWFHRSRVARIEAKQRLIEVLKKQNQDIERIENGEYDNAEKIIIIKGEATPLSYSVKDQRTKKLTYAYSQLTLTIAKIYEIDSDFDPEQYIDKKIMESIDEKISESQTEIS